MTIPNPSFLPESRHRPGWPAAIALIVGFWLMVLAPAQGADSRDLKALREDIRTVERDINSRSRTRDQTSQLISGLDSDINEVSRKRRGARKRLGEAEQELESLQQQLKKAEGDLDAESDTVRSLVRNVHRRGRQPYMKILLGEIEPSRLGRTLVWYRYVANARSEAITEVRDRIKAIGTLNTKITSRRSELENLTSTLEADETRLKEARGKRRELLASIDKDLASKTARIETLRDDEQELARLIEAVREAAVQAEREAEQQRKREAAEAARLAAAREQAELAAEAEKSAEEKAEPEQTVVAKSEPKPAPKPKQKPRPIVPPPAGTRFAENKGRMPFPVDGRIIAKFGDRKRGDDDLTWQGLLLGANEGAPVRAIADGVVRWTGPMPGYGLVMLIYHGDNYVTSYLHNSELLRESGAQVRAGDVIAHVGSSGLDKPGLYLVIRAGNASVDPLKWLKR